MESVKIIFSLGLHKNVARDKHLGIFQGKGVEIQSKESQWFSSAWWRKRSHVLQGYFF